MDLEKVLAELRFERAQLASAIESLEKLFSNRRRGRPSRSSVSHSESRKQESVRSADKYAVAAQSRV